MLPQWSGNELLPPKVANNEEWKTLIATIDNFVREYSTEEPPIGGQVTTFSIQCEMCKEKEATIYCGQDKAHLCAECDEAHHVRSKLLMKHSRLPLYHSPFQFGFCPEHQSDRLECVCLECGVMLCQLCLLVGSHGDKTEHPIISTVEAFRLSLTPSGGDFGEILSKVNGKPFFAVPEKKEALINELHEQHQLIVQAESNYWQIQQVLDRELRTCLDFLEKIRVKRTDFLNALRREDLLLLTLLEWYQAFQVHARLSLSPSLWLRFFKACSSEDLFIPSLLGAARSVPIDSVAEYIAGLPPWVTSQVVVEGTLSVQTDRINQQRLETAYRQGPTVITSQFEWVPSAEPKFELPPQPLSPEALRKNRLAARLEELVKKPQDEENVRKLTIPFPANMSSPIPIDSVKDFVMQTLAVLAESESRIPNLDFFENQSYLEPARREAIQQEAQTKEQTAAAAEKAFGLPPVISERADAGMAVKLKSVLISGGSTPREQFSNAVSVLAAAPSSERQDLFLSMAYLFRGTDSRTLEDLIVAVCKDTVERVEASSFLVSGISMLVPITAAFQLSLFPQDSTFLDIHLQTLVSKAGTSQSAEQGVNQFIANISMPSSNVVFPESLNFLLKSVHSACLSRFSAQVSVGVVSGLLLARVISPRLVFFSPKTDTTQPPLLITMMTRYIHRVAGAAAEGQSSLSSRSDKDAVISGILTAISQLNGLVMRNVLNATSNNLPALSGGLTPRSAAVKVDRKLREFGSSLGFE
jgi:hypothetical protein